jgi:hypothetical protein
MAFVHKMLAEINHFSIGAIDYDPQTPFARIQRSDLA